MDFLWTPWRMPYLQEGPSERDKQACVFCQKVHTGDDIAEHILTRSEHVFVTLNLYPYNNGHLMVVPCAHVGGPEAMPPEALQDLMVTANRAVTVLREAYDPHGFNLGANIGAAAGAGIPGHFHLHLVPRWSGDTNFMTVTAGVRVIPQWIDQSYEQLSAIWQRLYPISPHSGPEE